jgi:EAL domain-containing protein (putative c-di-GMP-specific phosphodiesterase class I)
MSCDLTLSVFRFLQRLKSLQLKLKLKVEGINYSNLIKLHKYHVNQILFTLFMNIHELIN